MPPRDQRDRTSFVALAMLIAAALACNQPSTVPPTVSGPTRPVAQTTVTPLVPISPTPGALPSTPTETPSGPGPGGCSLAAQFISDVTIPDNTVLAPGAAFVKTWRVKNNGTCNWEAGYQLVFAEGNQMGGPAGVDVNDTLPGATVDISVNLTAPVTPGTHTGKWRLRASNGAIFGGLTVVIVVPATPTPTSVVTPTPTPTLTTTGAVWQGFWETNCGSSNCGAMELTQSGNLVTGRYAINTSLTGAITGTVSGDRLSGTWSRSGTSGQFDWWMGGSGVKWRGNYDAINGWCGHRAGESDPVPCGVGTFQGDWIAVCAGCDGPVHVDQDGKDFAGTYANGTLEGTIDGIKADGTWHFPPNRGPFTWHLINSKQFNGNYNGVSNWCGYRSGSSQPLPCLK